MKNFFFNNGFLSLLLAAILVPALSSCDDVDEEEILSPSGSLPPAQMLSVSPESVARMLSEIPISLDQVLEVKEGVDASSDDGYDEEYLFSRILSSPVKGVVGTSLGEMIREYAASFLTTRASGFIEELVDSKLQIYWPYSDSWDKETIPVITFIPDYSRDRNVGFGREILPDGSWIVKEVMVDEEYAMAHPVWVVNWNDDTGAITPQVLEKMLPDVLETKGATNFKTLRLKEFKAHRQYDSWFSGGSEFYFKIGSLKAFTADVVSDLKMYNPEITDLMIKVKRGQVGKAIRYNAILVSDWSDQLSDCAFLIHEDDGGKMTTWKSSGTVKIKSKSYGFEVEIPYHRNDDIVWRGKLSSNYLTKYNGVSGRMGDVSVTFTFD